MCNFSKKYCRQKIKNVVQRWVDASKVKRPWTCIICTPLKWFKQQYYRDTRVPGSEIFQFLSKYQIPRRSTDWEFSTFHINVQFLKEILPTEKKNVVQRCVDASKVKRPWTCIICTPVNGLSNIFVEFIRHYVVWFSLWEAHLNPPFRNSPCR